jgi:hypothetical protein
LYRQVPPLLVYVQVAKVQQDGLAAIDEIRRWDFGYGLLFFRSLSVDGSGGVDGCSRNLCAEGIP